MSKLYIILLAIASFLVSSVGATFSIAGLISLFAGATMTVGFMAGSLEFAKLVTAGFLYRYWGHVNYAMRVYLSVAVVILSGITSMGIFGYLSNAYQVSSMGMKTKLMEIESLKRQDVFVREEIKKVETFINEIPRNRISKKFQLYEESRNQIKGLNLESMELNRKIETLKQDMLRTQTEVGPIVYVAEALDTDVDRVARWLILIFVSVFDPLAICLVFALGLAIRLKEKYRGNENRIARLALSRPVDHRFKKGA